MLKEMLEYLGTINVCLKQTAKGWIVPSDSLDSVDRDKFASLVPDGFFFNPSVIASADTIAKAQRANQPIPEPTIGFFIGKGNLSDEEHCKALLEGK